MPLLTDQNTETRNYLPERLVKPDKRSKLIKARAKFPGEIINACPYNCTVNELDHRTYCKHLIGFTDPDEGIDPNDPPEFYYPQTRRRDPKTGKAHREHIFTDGTNPLPVPEGAFLVEGTTCYRVYVQDPPKLPVERLLAPVEDAE
jgi:hypothetical protein